jgi:hypothetical protein
LSAKQDGFYIQSIPCSSHCQEESKRKKAKGERRNHPISEAIDQVPFGVAIIAVERPLACGQFLAGLSQSKGQAVCPIKASVWWTLSQRIRTIAEIVFEVALLETEPSSKYQQIAERAIHLNQLGICNEANGLNAEEDPAHTDMDRPARPRT